MGCDKMYDVYTIKEGDTIESIANKYNITPYILYQLNGINNNVSLIPGNNISDFSREVNKDDNILYYLKRETKYPIVTIVMVTQNSENYEKKYLKLGFNDYIQKPINKKNLDAILNKYFI